MSKNLDAYYARKSHEEVQRNLRHPLAVLWLGAVALVGTGVMGFPALEALARIALGLGLAVAALGVHRAREWSRRLGAALFAALFVGALVGLAQGEGWRRVLPSALLSLYAMVTLLSKETGEHFAWIRGERSTDAGGPGGED